MSDVLYHRKQPAVLRYCKANPSAERPLRLARGQGTLYTRCTLQTNPSVLPCPHLPIPRCTRRPNSTPYTPRPWVTLRTAPDAHAHTGRATRAARSARGPSPRCAEEDRPSRRAAGSRAFGTAAAPGRTRRRHRARQRRPQPLRPRRRVRRGASEPASKSCDRTCGKT